MTRGVGNYLHSDNIPLGNITEDNPIWHYTRNGEFSVCSASHVIVDCALTKSTEEEREASSSSGTLDLKFVVSKSSKR